MLILLFCIFGKRVRDPKELPLLRFGNCGEDRRTELKHMRVYENQTKRKKKSICILNVYGK